MASTRQTIRILCFGDSLTAGYSCDGAMYTPYAMKLAQMLSMALPHVDIEEVEDGMPGDWVRKGFNDRLRRQFKKVEAARAPEKPFDWTIILGGTNDLAYANNPIEDIFADLKKCWDFALSQGSKVLALTIPEVGVDGFRANADARRNQLNDWIKGHKQENFYAFDLHAIMPYFALSPTDRDKYWDDHVHFTPAGYDLIGQKVGMHLVSILIKEKSYPVQPPKRRRGFKDDKLVFEEEDGDPSAIDQGYYVVRWQDLA